MTTRTTSRTVIFQHPFVLDGFARDAPAGTYLVQTEEELMDTVLSVVWKRTSTLIRVRTAAGTQDIFIDPEQLDAALLRDRAERNAPALEAAAPPAAHVSRRRNLVARRIRKT